MKRLLLTFLLLSAQIVLHAAELQSAVGASPRERIRLDDDWRFIQSDPKDAAAAALDDSTWRLVTLPHDWSIESKIDAKAPMGGGGGFFPAGIAWYRQLIKAPSAWQGKKIEVEFEGVYENSEVYLNGQKIAAHPYGYTTFFVDLTPALKPGAANVLAVRVDNSMQPNSRWYSGSGIYRHVWLHITNPIRVGTWGVFAQSTTADAAGAEITVSTKISNPTSAAVEVQLQSEILGPQGESLGKMASTCRLPAQTDQQTTQTCQVKNPPLWSPEAPRISQVVTRIMANNILLDKVTTPFGIRHLAWSVKDGFTINGKTYKLKGGCIHGDNGVLGACAFDRAEERKIERIKAAGFNAVRLSHNPFSPALLEVCDRLGMLVMENSFDCWTKGKNRKDYQLYFKDWWERDLDAMILRDRNHPSIVMWDLGNEIPDKFTDPEVAAYGPKLVARVHSLDKTRAVTTAAHLFPDEKKPGQMENAELGWGALDIVGSNYTLNQHVASHDKHPDRVLVSTESLPMGWPQLVLNNSYVVGDFVWTAQDYFGESGLGKWSYQDDQGKGEYPCHGSISGHIDILGNYKPYYRHWQIRWQTGLKLGMAVRQPVGDRKIGVKRWGSFPTFDSWTWPGWEQKPVDVEVYSSYPQTRLYLNDKMVGEQSPKDGLAKYIVSYQPGTLKAVGLDNGKEVEEVKLATVGAAKAIRLKPDRTVITADGQGLSFIDVEVVDDQGRLQPNANQVIHFTLTGPGVIAGLGNANMKSEEPYQGTQCSVFHGQALVVLRSSRQGGVLTLKAQAEGFGAAEVQVTSH